MSYFCSYCDVFVVKHFQYWRISFLQMYRSSIEIYDLTSAGCTCCGWQFFCFIVGDVALGAPGPKGCSACFGLPMV